MINKDIQSKAIPNIIYSRNCGLNNCLLRNCGLLRGIMGNCMPNTRLFPHFLAQSSALKITVPCTVYRRALFQHNADRYFMRPIAIGSQLI